MQNFSSKPGSSFCRHELERRAITPKTLHELMMTIAEPIIQHNWTDVAIHDKAKLKNIPVGHHCIWIVGKMGSYLTPMYCNVSDRSRWTSDFLATISPVQILIVRWYEQTKSFSENSHWNANHDPVQDKHCFFVVKTDSKGAGNVIPVTYKELADMAVYRKFQMVTTGT